MVFTKDCVEAYARIGFELNGFVITMSGHSKWSTIKRAKAANDAKRSKVFSKLSRLITTAARQGGGDPGSNPGLRLAMEKAKYARMPKDNVDKAINKGLGKSGDGMKFESVVYEGYGPEGVAFLIQALTDNKNRTVAEIRGVFSRVGGSLGTAGSTTYIFADKENPVFEVDISDDAIAKKLVSLAETLEDHDDVQEVYANFNLVGDLGDR